MLRTLLHHLRLMRNDWKRAARFLIKLSRKKVFQSVMRCLRRLETARGRNRPTDRRFFGMLDGITGREALLQHFADRDEPRFFLSPDDRETLVRLVKEHYPDAIDAALREADDACEHVFDLLGSGRTELGDQIDWHRDFKSGFRWPMRFHAKIERSQSQHGADVKVPWELSRCHHFVALGKAYWFTGDEKYARAFADQLEDWIDNNPPQIGVNWCCAMDVAIRMVNWVWAYYYFADSDSFTDKHRVAFLKSVPMHAAYVRENLEYYGEFSNNHYLSEVVGLVFAGFLFPEFKHAQNWKALGLREVLSELDDQVHQDGVDFEGSTSYHRLVLEFFATTYILCTMNGVEWPARARLRLERMFEFVLHYTKPDGRIAQIGDTDNGRLQILSETEVLDHRYLLSIGAVLFDRSDFKIAAGPFHEEALWLLGEHGLARYEAIPESPAPLTSRGFEHGGVYVMRSEDLQLVADCGPNGRRGRGDHSHNDLLSFELYAFDKSFIVDPGTYVYSPDPQWRNVFRSTAYHNTVTVDGQEMNRILPGKLFMLQNDAKPNINLWKITPRIDLLDAEHDGYERLDDPVTHRRQIIFHKVDQYVLIRDTLVGREEHDLAWHFHFDIGIPLMLEEGATVETRCPSGANLILCPVGPLPICAELVAGWVSRSYGVKEPAETARYTYAGPTPVSATFALCPYRTADQRDKIMDTLQQAETFEAIWNAIV